MKGSLKGILLITVRTSIPQFCVSCHEIRFAYNAWKTSTHVNNSQGFVADYMDCYLPAPHDIFNFFYAKTAHGIGKDFWCSGSGVIHPDKGSYAPISVHIANRDDDLLTMWDFSVFIKDLYHFNGIKIGLDPYVQPYLGWRCS